jgi:hypothetical protein
MGFLFLIIILFALIYFKYKLPFFIGMSGERYVAGQLNKLDQRYYKILNDLLLPSQGNTATTQIDHLVVSNFGVFVIETKSYKGWIFGRAEEEYWTQVIYNYRKKFYNPLRQNYAHVKAVENLIKNKFLNAQIVSLIVFPHAGRLKIIGTDSVGYVFDAINKIKSFSQPIFTDFEREMIYSILISANAADRRSRFSHDDRVRELIKTKQKG